jgi:hypothetical protein
VKSRVTPEIGDVACTITTHVNAILERGFETCRAPNIFKYDPNVRCQISPRSRPTCSFSCAREVAIVVISHVLENGSVEWELDKGDNCGLNVHQGRPRR